MLLCSLPILIFIRCLAEVQPNTAWQRTDGTRYRQVQGYLPPLHFTVNLPRTNLTIALLKIRISV